MTHCPGQVCGGTLNWCFVLNLVAKLAELVRYKLCIRRNEQAGWAKHLGPLLFKQLLLRPILFS